jgi:LmbE family N-acetylglucosaminyl deacetylase
VYRITQELGGIVDQVVVTNGEGGTQYAAPAQTYYRTAVRDESWRKQLVRIRRRELIEAGRILGIRNHYFLKQPDTGFTLDSRDAFRDWNTNQIRQEIFYLLRREKYDLVVVLLPSADTHGHHKTIALLTLDVIAELEARDRPATLGAQTLPAGEAMPDYLGLDNHRLTRPFSAKPIYVFDRRTPMHCHAGLDYSVISNWVIAEHKSQGAFQMEFGRKTLECFWLFELSGEPGKDRWRKFIDRDAPATPSQAQPIQSDWRNHDHADSTYSGNASSV